MIVVFLSKISSFQRGIAACNVQNMKLVQFCTDFIFRTFSEIVTLVELSTLISAHVSQ